MTSKKILQLLRIRQWTKNFLIFAALIFSNHAHQLAYSLKSVTAFFLFSLCSGALYTFNDIFDRENDREHPVKKLRPIASGEISVSAGWLVVLCAGGLSIGLSFLLSIPFGVTMVVYSLLQCAYTVFLKKIVIIDVFSISFGFILRVVAGALAIGVVISSWILVCTMLLALFLALSKRRHELILLDANANNHRLILKEYSPYLLDQMIGIVTSATLVAYTIFTLSEETTAKFGNMVVTVPFVLYGIFRYLYLVHIKEKGGQPEEILLTDIPLQIDIILYGLTALAVIYF